MNSGVEFLAGFVSGLAGLVIGSPFDIIKTRSQNHVSRSKISWSPSSWFTGLLMPFIGLGFLNAILFWSYALVVRSDGGKHTSEPSLGLSFLAGAFSGLCGCIISIPTELVKVRAQTSDHSSLDVIYNLWQRKSLAGFWRGSLVTIFREVLGYGLYFLPFEALSQPLTRLMHNETLGILLSGGSAGCIAWLAIFPLDTIKTRIQADNNEYRPLLTDTPETLHNNSLQNVARTIYREAGVAGFFRGLIAAMFRAFLVNAVIFGVDQWILTSLR